MPATRTLKTMALAIALGTVLVPIVIAQQDFHTREASGKKHPKDEKKSQSFPNATRTEPNASLSEAMFKPVNELLAEVNVTGKESDVLAKGAELAARKDANPTDRAYIYEAMAYACINKGDDAAAIGYIQKSLGENAQSNNDYYQQMLLLAKIQIRSKQTDAGLQTLARLVAETKDDKPEYDGLRGRVYYSQKDYANAAKTLQRAVDASADKPVVAEQQMLMQSYLELKQPERAEQIGEGLLKTNPSDKDAIANLAAVYQQAGQDEKAIALLDDARKRGALDDADGYRTLYALYSRIKGHENDSIAVINEGLEKGILQPNEEVYLQLGDNYYFTDRNQQAIDAYKKADAMASDGNAALNLAKIYHNQGQLAQAAAMAQRALQKGLAHPEDARKLIELTGAASRKPGKKK